VRLSLGWLQGTLSLGNCPFPFNNPLLFVIPSEAEGSAVRHSGTPNLAFYHFPFVILSSAQDDVFVGVFKKNIPNKLALMRDVGAQGQWVLQMPLR
jgi:hypothetical protein